ncbi:MAG: hemolysin family protein [Eggerthellaceae bacterium]
MDIGLCIASYGAVAVAAAGLSALITRAVCNRRNSQGASEEQIRDLVTDSDDLLEDEKSMIHEIIELGDMTAMEVMQPRMDMILVQDTDTVRQAAERMTGTGYSRLPVFHEDVDQIVGIVHYKDLFPALVDGRGDELVGDFAYEPMYVPVTKDVLPLLSEMQNSHQQMAIVVDEYGGTGGVVTFEDIVEEIVGEILDEKDRDGSFLRVVREGEWVADGRLPVDDAAELGWPVQESDDYETLAGWLMSVWDKVPQTGDQLVLDGYDFKIEGMRRRRVKRVRVRKTGE